VTIVVVADGNVFVDSLQSWGGSGRTVDKRCKSKLGDWTSVGNVNIAETLMRDWEHSQDFKDFSSPIGDRESFSAVILKRPDGSIWTLDAQKGAKPQEQMLTKEAVYVNGSGSDFFLAYYAAFNDVTKALKLTATFCTSCGLPIRAF